ncbi:MULTISPECIES: hypothetical protein [Deefgea]|uniref:Uncharacterized protein n=1 Tax=Deefgea chitinilytica TaxID=570276 RepID=A0ABS2CFT0_9NEIS|nr:MULTISPECIES: hypothetical protein [Deefgea]MBM5573009.1 hypothetical protein [Deefgea chitinilytica]MBM9890245.1 hypothetical protein [Deefgea sp. CFH1-16]
MFYASLLLSPPTIGIALMILPSSILGIPGLGLLFTLVRWAYGYVTKWLFLNTYRKSHQIWTDRHQLGAYWTKCGEYFEYSYNFALQVDDRDQKSKIAFKSLRNDIQRISLIFETESVVARYQEYIKLNDLTEKPIIMSLSNIPRLEISGRFKDGMPFFSWDDFYLRNVQIDFIDGTVVNINELLRSSMTQTWAFNSKWKRKWSSIWNVDAIDWAQHRMALYWQYRFGMPLVRIYVPYSVQRKLTFELLLAIATRPIALIMASKAAISIQFWLAIWSGLFVLNNESELQWRWGKADELESI